MSSDIPSFRVFRPLVAILLTLALSALVIADRLTHGLHPLGLSPRLWASVVFPIQIFSFCLYRALRGYRKPRARGQRHSTLAPPRFSSLEFAEVCAFVLTLGYWFLTNERLDAMLQPGWRVVVAGILLAIPLLAKVMSEPRS